MLIDLQEYKKYNDNYEFVEGLIYNFINEPKDKESLSYQTLEGLGFITDDYFNLDSIEQYDISLLVIVLKKIVDDLVWLSDYSNEDFSFEDIENQTEEEYLESIENKDPIVSSIDEESVYYKTLKGNNLISKKKDKYTLNLENIKEYSVDILNYFVSESVSMIANEGFEYNETVTDTLKKLKVIK